MKGATETLSPYLRSNKYYTGVPRVIYSARHRCTKHHTGDEDGRHPPVLRVSHLRKNGTAGATNCGSTVGVLPRQPLRVCVFWLRPSKRELGINKVLAVTMESRGGTKAATETALSVPAQQQISHRCAACYLQRATPVHQTSQQKSAKIRRAHVDPASLLSLAAGPRQDPYYSYHDCQSPRAPPTA
ncbi:hypothetical protein NDU88_006752 [Pleurodeles waltl]|uniref:Uncharacterized protein n=1 Tax=Pleurodeles waltl TaxID=8319 RepID=A0AAV7X2G7_PLEWA|nr:hypothetical protein NDU88_006752 [Pleurodeles waltl]